MWWKSCNIIFLLFLKLKFSNSSFENEYPGMIICQSDNLQQETIRDTNSSFEIINAAIKKNCTHIQGSLYIRGFTDLEGFSKELHFDSIKEIDGHLIIENNAFEKISLKNLRIIRGFTPKRRLLVNSSAESISLEVIGNLNLKELDIRSLRSIADHNIIIHNNPKLRYIPHRINWNELFTKSKNQKIITSPKTQDFLKRDQCSNKCEFWNNASQTYCWGPQENQCQQRVLCSPPYSEHCELCNYKNGISCCSDQCIGGCTGIGQGNCIACKNMLNENKCTESCPGRYTGGVSGTTQNKEFKYHTGSFCSRTCPFSMLPEESTCVHKCSEDYFRNKENQCVKCYDDKCKKVCDMMAWKEKGDSQILDAVMLKKLKNCTAIRGYIVITDRTFIRNGVTVPMLYENLNKVNDLEGGFSYFKDNTLKNLTFLGNLKIFRAANLHVSMSGMAPYYRFYVASTDLEFLGLKNLEKIYGPFYFFDNKKLCYMNTNWSSIANVEYRNINKHGNCSGKSCDPECTPKGCWGPGPKMCMSCQNYDAGGVCVSNCNKIKGFYKPKNMAEKGVCSKCHKECKNSCSGPSPSECVKGCLNRKENGVCVPNCSKNFYPSTEDINYCFPCHENCTEYDQSTCTGPSSVPGPGGCNKCTNILINRNFAIVNCVKNCPSNTYEMFTKSEIFSSFFPKLGYLCHPCHELCEKCIGKSDKSTDCEICTKFWHKERCISVCPKNESYGNETTNNRRECKSCHPSCADGCTGPKNTDCFRCKHRKIYIKTDPKIKQFYCNKTCPDDKPFGEMESETNEYVCRSAWESTLKMEEWKRTKITVAVVLIMLLVVIFVIVIIVVCLRRKAFNERLEAELKAKYSNLLEPNSKDENGLNKPPNMGRLVIVSKEDLIFEDQTRPLGFGAFGYVYKGKWKIPRNEDTLLRKSSGDFYLLVAIKVIKNIGNEEMESILQEAKIMASVSHMHCLRFIGVCLSYDKPCLISTYVKDGSLDKYLVRNKNKITSLIMLSWCEQIADGMLYLTTRNIIHRDLAARNVLVNRLECVQITDFGLAKMLDNTKEKEIIIKTGKVPLRWLAIETLTEGKYSHETDVWAYGVTLWEIFTFGKIPYEDQATHDIFDFVLKGGRLCQPDICSLDVYILMVNCWLESPNLRPDFQNLMKTFIDYCKNPGRYLSIQGDPYEIPSPNSIEMTNLNNPYFGDHFNFQSATTETMLPLLNNRESTDREVKGFIDKDENDDLMNSLSDKESLPTRSNNRTGNLFKRFQENRQPQNSSNTRANNTPRLASLASHEDSMFRNQSLSNDDDPRYVADPTDKLLKMRPQMLKSNFLHETPRFHSNISRDTSNHSSLSADGQLEPPMSNKNSLINNNMDTDAEGYLEPVNNSNKFSFNQGEYMVPSHPTTPKEITLNNKPVSNNNAFKQSRNYLTMDDNNSPQNFNHSNSVNDDEYLEPEPNRRLIKSSHR